MVEECSGLAAPRQAEPELQHRWAAAKLGLTQWRGAWVLPTWRRDAQEEIHEGASSGVELDGARDDAPVRRAGLVGRVVDWSMRRVVRPGAGLTVGRVSGVNRIAG